MQPVLNRQFSDAARYAGQQCLVRMEWQPHSRRYAVTQTQGDEALCLRAWQLVAQTRDLPPPEPGQPAWFGFAPRG